MRASTIPRFPTLPYQKQTNGFFIESGANDGEYHSNTLYMERYLNWTGLLVEPGVNAYNKLISRNRKAYTLQGCVSTKPYPIKVSSYFFFFLNKW